MPKKEAFGRREFLEKGGLALGAVAAMPALPPSLAGDAATVSMPQRVLGRTGVAATSCTPRTRPRRSWRR
jgi:hypothetical protein